MIGDRTDNYGEGQQGYFYTTPVRAEVEASDDVIIINIHICQQTISTLFDPLYIFLLLAIVSTLLEVSLCVLTLVGDSLVVDQVCRFCLVIIQGYDTQALLFFLI